MFQEQRVFSVVDVVAVPTVTLWLQEVLEAADLVLLLMLRLARAELS